MERHSPRVRLLCVANTLCHKLAIYQVKNFIRQAKKWRDDEWPEDEGGEGRPSSYLISLLVIKAFNIAQSTRYIIADDLIDLV